MMNIEDVLKGHGIGSSGGSNIKSIQRGNTTMQSTTAINIPISAVDMTKSVVLIYSYGSNNINAALIKASLTSPTNLQCSTFDNSAVAFTWVVIEFTNIKSFQSGNTQVACTGTTVTVSSVNIAKSHLFYNFMAKNNSQYSQDSFLQGYIASATSLYFECSGSVSKDTNWYLVEFN